ncbi:MAG: sigma-70 family RNA polymerase sigma factor [Candidatus Sulfotelmatobacter sp.]
MPDDRQTWERIRQGDAQAFGEFYRQNAPRLEVFLRHVVGDAQAAEDIMQETFTEIWLRPNGFQPERGALRAYLFGIGRKRAAEWWRMQGPKSPEAEDNAIPALTETAAVIDDAFRRLPEEQRSLLWLREVEGQSYAELAGILGVPIGTVRSRLFAAREALRKRWKSPRPV